MKSYSKTYPFLNYSDEPTGRLALVFELMEMNLYDAIKGISILIVIDITGRR